MLPKLNRLTKKTDFGAVFKKGRTFKEDSLILKFTERKTKDCRFGVIVSKKISKKAVVRNRVKRKIRSAIGGKMLKVKPGADIIFLALPGLENKDFQEIKKIICTLLKKAKLIGHGKKIGS